MGVQLHRLDHFNVTPPAFWQNSPSNVGHLAQNKVEVILREQVEQRALQSTAVDLLLGYNVSELRITNSGVELEAVGCTTLTKEQRLQLECKYLIGADGANSFVRNAFGIPMQGDDSIQHLVNVHFSCPGLRPLLQPRPAMLYFVFNEVPYVLHVCTSCCEYYCNFLFGRNFSFFCTFVA